MMVFSPPFLAQEKMKFWGEGVNLPPPPPIQNRIKSANFIGLYNHPLSMIVLCIDWGPTL